MATKAIISIGYAKYVVDASDAVKLAEIMANAELYTDKWRKPEDGGTTHHIWEQDEHTETPIRVIPNNLYRMYKLAGKPEET